MPRKPVSELVVPLRNAWNITRCKRSPRAMQIIREQVIRHLKVKEDEAQWSNATMDLSQRMLKEDEA